MDSNVLMDRLIAAVSEDRKEAGLVVEAVYQPVGGRGGKVMPPTYPAAQDGSPYLCETVWIDGEEVKTVVIDQVPSQANRDEQAMLNAHNTGRVALPLFVMDADGVRLTSLDFPHRYADAYLRDSEVDGVRFDESGIGKLLRSASAEDVRPLFEREPYSLIFGAWDSHRAGRWPKFARLYTSMMYGLHPLIGDRRGGRMDPMNLTGAVNDKAKAETDWEFVPEGAKAKGQKLSEIGHGNIAPNPAHGGVSVQEVRRRASVSFAGLSRLRFGDASVGSTDLARACLAALALMGDRLAFGSASVSLRSGCDLVRISEVVAFELAGGDREPIEVTTNEAIGAFVGLRERCVAADIPMASDVVPITPTRQLREAIAYARTKATSGED